MKVKGFATELRTFIICLRKNCRLESAEKSFVGFPILGTDFTDGKYLDIPNTITTPT